MKIAFKTFGCKANSVDTDSIHLEALRRGYTVVSENDAADAYIINSCTVTARADRDCRWQVQKFKRLNPHAAIAMVGCYSQVARGELLAVPEIDFVVGTSEKTIVLDYLANHQKGEKLKRDQVTAPSGFLPDTFRGSRNARATIKIQDGCNFKCSYCIIPQARGRSRSLPVEIVLKQLREAAQLGFTEVTLTGIHLAHYGWDRNSSLIELLKQIEKAKEPLRIRLSTLDPFEIPDDLIELVASNSLFCPHYHIALQSGSDLTLKAMKRIYKAKEFVDVTENIYKRDPRTFIGVDVIVGFPQEDETEFTKTLQCLKVSPWTKLHVFPFSVRRGTMAETLPDKISTDLIKERAMVLRDLSEKRYTEFINKQIGSQCDVLIEKPSQKHSGAWTGHTENYIPVLIPWNAIEPRRIINATLLSIEGSRAWAKANTVQPTSSP